MYIIAILYYFITMNQNVYHYLKNRYNKHTMHYGERK